MDIKIWMFLIFAISASRASILGKFSDKFSEISRRNEVKGFVAGGNAVELGEIPYFALIIKIDGISGETQQCGGSLIRYNWVLTSASCIATNFSEIFIYLGIVDKFQYPSFESRLIERSNFFLHANFSEENLSNDIGLIYLPSATPQLLDHPYIDVIDLPSSDEANLNLVGRIAAVSGFGSTGGSVLSTLLNQVEMQIVENQKCLEALPPFVSEGNLCTETGEDRSACPGDEGGPLTTLITPDREVLIGIVGFTVETCTWGTPGIYARVSTHLEWIYNVIGESTPMPTTPADTTTETTSTTTQTTTTTEKVIADSAPSSAKLSLFLIISLSIVLFVK